MVNRVPIIHPKELDDLDLNERDTLLAAIRAHEEPRAENASGAQESRAGRAPEHIADPDRMIPQPESMNVAKLRKGVRQLYGIAEQVINSSNQSIAGIDGTCTKPESVNAELLAAAKSALNDVTYDSEEAADAGVHALSRKTIEHLHKAITCAEQAMQEGGVDALRKQAEAAVLKIRGSYDAPGFDACVEAEIKAIQEGGPQ